MNEHWASVEWYWQGMILTGKTPKYLEEKTDVVSLCPPQIVTRADLGSIPDSNIQSPATNLMSHAAACSLSTIYSSHFSDSINHIKSSCF